MLFALISSNFFCSQNAQLSGWWWTRTPQIFGVPTWTLSRWQELQANYIVSAVRRAAKNSSEPRPWRHKSRTFSRRYSYNFYSTNEEQVISGYSDGTVTLSTFHGGDRTSVTTEEWRSTCFKPDSSYIGLASSKKWATPYTSVNALSDEIWVTSIRVLRTASCSLQQSLIQHRLHIRVLHYLRACLTGNYLQKQQRLPMEAMKLNSRFGTWRMLSKPERTIQTASQQFPKSENGIMSFFQARFGEPRMCVFSEFTVLHDLWYQSLGRERLSWPSTTHQNYLSWLSSHRLCPSDCYWNTIWRCPSVRHKSSSSSCVRLEGHRQSWRSASREKGIFRTVSFTL